MPKQGKREPCLNRSTKRLPQSATTLHHDLNAHKASATLDFGDTHMQMRDSMKREYSAGAVV